MTPEFDSSRPVAIVGMGVMGTKIAWACARAGIPVHAYDIDADKARISKDLALTWCKSEERENVAGKLTVIPNLEAALEGVQFAFENVPEKLSLKQQVLSEIGSLISGGVYMGTNASSLTCSQLATASGHPGRFFNANFSDPRHSLLVEVMGCEYTEPETIAFATVWIRSIRMVPVCLRKEQLGYSMNRLWRVIKKEVLRQIDQGYITPTEIDRAWMLAFGTPVGPCGIMDEVGLHSVLAIEKIYHQDSGDEADRPPAALTDCVERNELGVITGKGFYEYPNPVYKQPGFVDGDAD